MRPPQHGAVRIHMDDVDELHQDIEIKRSRVLEQWEAREWHLVEYVIIRNVMCEHKSY